MEEDVSLNDPSVEEKLNKYIDLLKSSNWMKTADEKTIDAAFNISMELQKIYIQQNEESCIKKSFLNYRDINFLKSVDLLIENLIKSQELNEHLTLYVIKKYILLFSKSSFSDLLRSILTEVKLREELKQLDEYVPDVEIDWVRINNLLSEVDNNNTLGHVINVLKSETSVFLNAIKHSPSYKKETLIKQLIECLEIQQDLKLWFVILQEENIETFIELCAMYRSLLDIVMKFFDTFADEVESNYDEELNVKYCHLNLDFEDFIKVFQSFLNNKTVNEIIYQYLERKTLLDGKNFSFWIDVKACV